MTSTNYIFTMISLIFTPSVWNSVFLPLIIRLMCSQSHKYDNYGDYAWHNPCGLAVTCRGDAELLLPHFLQLQDLLQSLRYLRPDANIFPLPRLNTNQTQVKIREETEFMCQTDHALRLSGSRTSLVSSPGGGGTFCRWLTDWSITETPGGAGPLGVPTTAGQRSCLK